MGASLLRGEAPALAGSDLHVELEPRETVLKVRSDGPHVVTGDVDLAGSNADPASRGPLVCRGPLVVEGSDGRSACSAETRLCRCGHSRTKPFCDSSHEAVGFRG